MQPLSISLREAKDTIIAFLARYQSRFDDRKDDHFEAMELVGKLGDTAISIAEEMESARDAVESLSWGLGEMKVGNDELKRLLGDSPCCSRK